MRTWRRADAITLCGGVCAGSIARGDPMQVITLTGVTAQRVRCRHCADGPVPPDLPALAERVPLAPQPLVRAGVVKLPFDFKFRQFAEPRDREPGEDDA